MTDAGRRIAGRLDDHLDIWVLDQAHRVVGDVRLAGLDRIAERRGVDLLSTPLHTKQALLGPGDIEIREADQMHARRDPALREVHGAEFAGAHLANPHRLTARSALFEHERKVHRTRPRVRFELGCGSSGKIGPSRLRIRCSSNNHTIGGWARTCPGLTLPVSPSGSA